MFKNSNHHVQNWCTKSKQNDTTNNKKVRITISKATDFEAAVEGDKTGGDERPNTKNKALNPIPHTSCFPENPCMGQTKRDKQEYKNHFRALTKSLAQQIQKYP